MKGLTGVALRCPTTEGLKPGPVISLNSCSFMIMHHPSLVLQAVDGAMDHALGLAEPCLRSLYMFVFYILTCQDLRGLPFSIPLVVPRTFPLSAVVLDIEFRAKVPLYATRMSLFNCSTEESEDGISWTKAAKSA